MMGLLFDLGVLLVVVVLALVVAFRLPLVGQDRDDGV